MSISSLGIVREWGFLVKGKKMLRKINVIIFTVLFSDY